MTSKLTRGYLCEWMRLLKQYDIKQFYFCELPEILRKNKKGFFRAIYEGVIVEIGNDKFIGKKWELKDRYK